MIAAALFRRRIPYEHEQCRAGQMMLACPLTIFFASLLQVARLGGYDCQRLLVYNGPYRTWILATHRIVQK